MPWRERCRTVYAEVDGDGRLVTEDFERLLKKYEGKIKIVSVSAASNVTGYVNDVHAIARIAHQYGARIDDRVGILAFNMKMTEAASPLQMVHESDFAP